MNRDNLLFLVIGLLAGFIGGYVMHETMAARQPSMSPPGAGQAAGPAQPATGGAPGGGQPAMEQVQRLAAYVRDNPDDAAAVRQLANLNYDVSNWQRAAELYGRYLELEAGDVNAMTDLGATFRHLGKPEQALAQFRQAIELAPEHWQARFNEVLVLAFDLEDLPAANAAMAELAAMQPENPQVARLAAELEKRGEG